jgi:ATP-dependent Clp protease ATP-binding subunit ClpA
MSPTAQKRRIDAMPSIPQLERPLTSRALRAIEASDDAAAALNDEFLGTEHLLLGLLADDRSLAAQILAQHGVTAASVRASVVAARRPTRGK